MTGRLRTAAALLGLQAALPLNVVLTGAAAVAGLVAPKPRREADRPRTVLISGGKMTKALQLARSFHRAGHRVVLVEQARYRFTGHRFSRAVAAFHVVPDPTAPHYATALADIVRREGVDTYVPVSSPVSSLHDARAKEVLEPFCEVVHADADVVARLDDKHAFSELAASLNLPVPDGHRIQGPEDVDLVDFGARRYVLKSIPYDPVQRLDLTPLPRSTAAATAAFVRSKPITAQRPWILQELLVGQEYCTHSTVRDGEITLHCCCASSAFQVNYDHVEKPEIEAWVRRLVGALGLTGQVSFDVIEAADGTPYAIECNPRTHSAITQFGDDPDVAAAYLGERTGVLRPSGRPTYWLYHEVWRALCAPRSLPERVATLRRGRDAILDRSDPLPFLLVHHLQIPWLLLGNLVAGRPWVRIDFNIGKLVEPAGD